MLKYIVFIGFSSLIQFGFASDLPAGCSQDLVPYRDTTLNQWGFRDSSSGAVVISPQYREAQPFCSGLAAVKADGRWGYINKANDTKIPFAFEEARSFSLDKVATVRRKGSWELLSQNGQNLCTRKFLYMAPIAAGLSSARFLNDSDEVRSVFLDKTCTSVSGEFLEATSFFEGLVAVHETGGWRLLDREFRSVIPDKLIARPKFLKAAKSFIFEPKKFSKYLHLMRRNPQNEKLEAALYDRNTQKIIGWFDAISPFSDELAVVGVSQGAITGYGYYRLADEKWLTHSSFEDASPSPELFYAVKQNGLYGFLDNHFRWALPPRYLGVARHFHRATLSNGSQVYFAEVFEQTGKGPFECRKIRIDPQGNTVGIESNFVPCHDATGIQESSGYLQSAPWE